MIRRCLPLLLASLAALAPPAGATWSIILVDTATGEVGIAGCTCLEGLDLLKVLPVLVVGKGGGVAQSAIDSTGTNRKKIFENLKLGTPPIDIIPLLLEGDLQKKARQYGIVDLSPAAAGYTGGACFGYKQDLQGATGTLRYSIQGNILTGAPVISAAEAAVVGATGTLADRLVAGMEAARAMGGDGRCSCSIDQPQSCGAPPPSFEKAGHIAFMVVSRIGDIDGICNAAVGCASGTYWLKINESFQTLADPDPVLQLEQDYADFKAALAGHPDGLRSLAGFEDDEVLADGASTRTLTVVLLDHFGVPLASGGAAVSVAHAPGSAGLSAIGPVTDHGDGTYSAEVTAGAGTGTDLFAVLVDAGAPAATLFPYPALVLREALVADGDALPAGAGGEVALDLLGPDAAAGRTFVVAFSGAGSQPGQTLASGLHLPLNADRLFHAWPLFAAMGVLGGVPGHLDGGAHGQAVLQAAPGGLAALSGLTLSCAWFTVRPADFASNAVSVRIEPGTRPLTQ